MLQPNTQWSRRHEKYHNNPRSVAYGNGGIRAGGGDSSSWSKRQAEGFGHRHRRPKRTRIPICQPGCRGMTAHRRLTYAPTRGLPTPVDWSVSSTVPPFQTTLPYDRMHKVGSDVTSADNHLFRTLPKVTGSDNPPFTLRSFRKPEAVPTVKNGP